MKWVVLLLGLVFLTACEGEFEVKLPPLPNSTEAEAPVDMPTAGHAVTPNPFYPKSVEWLWDPQGIYLLAAGSSIAREIFNDQRTAITNVQGVVYSRHVAVDSSEPHYFIWLWTPLAVYRYETSTDSLLQMRDAAANELRDVKEIITFPGLDDKNDEVWLWTSDNFFRLTSSASGQMTFTPNSQPIAGIQAIKPAPDVRYVFLWTTTSLHLYDLQTRDLHEVKNPVASPITGVKGIWLEPIIPPEATEQFFTVLVWNDIDLYQMHFPTEPPFQMEKIVNNVGGGINQVQGIVKTLAGENAAQLWAWTPTSLYRLPGIPGAFAEITPLIIDGIQIGPIRAAASCSKPYAPLYLWSKTHVVIVNPAHPGTPRLLSRPDGLVAHNNLRQVIPCILSQTGRMGLPDEVWWWDDAGVYRQVMADGAPTPIFSPNNAYLTHIRGLMVGLHQRGQEIWLWNEGHVYRYQPESNDTQEILGPDQQPLVDTWMTLMRPEPNEPTVGYTILIRNRQNVYQYMIGNEYAMPVTVGGDQKTISSPPYVLSEDGVVMIGQSAHLDTEEMEGLFWPRLNTVLRFGGDAAAIIESGSGHCHNAAQDC